MKNPLPHIASIIDVWNNENPPDTPVTVVMDDGTTIDTTTITRASLFCGCEPVVWLSGISGCYSLDRVTKRGT